MNIENKLRELLLPVLGYTDVSFIQPDSSIVEDLGADSIDFVEIVYVIERNFGVTLKMNQIFSSSLKISAEELFQDGHLTKDGAELINRKLESGNKYKEGMSKIKLFSVLTVKDLAKIIEYQKKEVNP